MFWKDEGSMSETYHALRRKFISEFSSAPSSSNVFPSENEPPSAAAPANPSPKVAAPKPEQTEPYTAVEMRSLVSDLERRLLRGKIEEAFERLSTVVRCRIPASFTGAMKSFEDRIRSYRALLQETSLERTVEVPPLHRVCIQGGGCLVVRIHGRDSAGIQCETIQGIRSRFSLSMVEGNPEELNRYQALAEVALEFTKQCERKGIQAVESMTEVGRRWSFKTTKPVAGVVFFELADFCARWGANDRLVSLFDAAVDRDSDILASVHELRAERLCDLFLYALHIGSREEAGRSLERLNKSYADTTAYRRKILSDKDVQNAYGALFRHDIPLVRSHSPPNPEIPSGSPEEPSPASEPSSSEEIGRFETMPVGTSQSVLSLVRAGDDAFEKTLQHVRNSNPNTNPEGWALENRKALETAAEAFHAYRQAQEECERLGQAVPRALTRRFNEAQLVRAMCRKRSVSTK